MQPLGTDLYPPENTPAPADGQTSACRRAQVRPVGAHTGRKATPRTRHTKTLPPPKRTYGRCQWLHNIAEKTYLCTPMATLLHPKSDGGKKRPQNRNAMTLSKNKQKYIRGLELKKNRRAEGVFLAEGPKLVEDLMGHYTCRCLVATPEWLATHRTATADDIVEVTAEELQRASLQKSPQDVLAVFAQPNEKPALDTPARQLCLALDGVQDPGNLGTIVRIADWFGIERIFCSSDTADVFSPKAVQATMGSIARVRVHYVDSLEMLVQSLPEGTPVCGTFLDGDNLYSNRLPRQGLLVMGNEGKGIGQAVGRLCTHRLRIPNYPAGRETSDSLNVAIATAVVCAEFRRQAAGY